MTREQFVDTVLANGFYIVSEGTLKTEDLCEAFMPFVFDEEAQEDFETLLEEDSDACWEEMLEYFDDVLDETGIFLGSQEGDPACMGFFDAEQTTEV